LAILKAFGQPLAVTSANRSGSAETVTGAAAHRLFDGRVEMVVDAGTCPGGTASTVLNVTSTAWTLARPGPVSKEQILKHLDL
jgi:L-threonylcarbamoyladenylate synthase